MVRGLLTGVHQRDCSFLIFERRDMRVCEILRICGPLIRRFHNLEGLTPSYPVGSLLPPTKICPALPQYTLPLTTPTPPRTCISRLRAEEHGRSGARAVHDAATVCLRDRCAAAGRGGCSERGLRPGRDRTRLGIRAPTARRRALAAPKGRPATGCGPT